MIARVKGTIKELKQAINIDDDLATLPLVKRIDSNATKMGIE